MNTFFRMFSFGNAISPGFRASIPLAPAKKVYPIIALTGKHAATLPSKFAPSKLATLATESVSSSKSVPSSVRLASMNAASLTKESCFSFSQIFKGLFLFILLALFLFCIFNCLKRLCLFVIDSFSDKLEEKSEEIEKKVQERVDVKMDDVDDKMDEVNDALSSMSKVKKSCESSIAKLEKLERRLEEKIDKKLDKTKGDLEKALALAIEQMPSRTKKSSPTAKPSLEPSTSAAPTPVADTAPAAPTPPKKEATTLPGPKPSSKPEKTTPGDPASETSPAVKQDPKEQGKDEKDGGKKRRWFSRKK